MSEATGPSVRESLQAARVELTGDAPTGGAELTGAPEVAATAPVPQAPIQGADGVPADPVAAAANAEVTGQERGPDGKFLPKKPGEEGAQAAAPAQPKPETVKPAEPGPQETEATRVPPSLSAAVKAQWSELPPEVRKDISRLEESVQTAKAEWGKKGERLNRYDEIIGPHVDTWRLNGLDEFSGVQTLLAAQAILERDPVQGLVHVARSYGVSAQQIAQALGLPAPTGHAPGAGGQPAPTPTPDLSGALKPLVDRIQTLESGITASQRANQDAELARLTADVEAFANDPANLYFHNVEQRMAALITSKQATGLKDAYEQAIWMDPEIRPILIKAQAAPPPTVDPAKKAAEEAQRRKAAEAARSSGSVTGAPAPGAQAPKEPPGSIRDSIRAAKQELGATV